MLHNRYREPGGEDLSVRAEVDNLRTHGIEVIDQQFDNEVSRGSGVAGSLRLALGAAWSRRSHEEISQLCKKHSPDVAHVQNFWMKLSPSVHDACHAAGVPRFRLCVTSGCCARTLCSCATPRFARTVLENFLGEVSCAAVTATRPSHPPPSHK